MFSLAQRVSWVRYWVLVQMVLVGPAFADEPPPTSQVVGMTRPGPQGFALHPDQRTLATLHANGAELADLKTLAVKRKLGIDEPPSSAIVFSPDGALVAIGHEQGVVSIWRLDGRRVTWVKGHVETVMALAFSSDGRWLASGGHDGTVQVWSTANWNRVVTLDGVAAFPGGEHSQAVLGLQFSPDSRFLYSLETLYREASRNHALTRVLSAWETGSWIETGRLFRRLKDMNFNGLGNPLAGPFALSNWGKARIFVDADDGYGEPKNVIPPTIDKLRSIAVDECFPNIGDPDDLFPSDTWPTALAAHSAKGWLAAAYLGGRGVKFSPGIALIPLGNGAAQRNWLTSRQSIQLVFDGADRLYSLSTDGQITAWDLGSLKTLAPAKEGPPGRVGASCQPENEAPSAQRVAPAARKKLVQLAKWTMDPELKKSLLSWPDFSDRFDLVGDRLILWGPQNRIFLDATTGTTVERDAPLSEGEFLIPSRMASSLFVARSDSLLAISPESGVRRTLEQKPGWELIGASVTSDYFATAWRKQTDKHPQPVEFHVLPATGGKTRVLQPAAFREAAVSKNLSVSPYRGSPLSFVLSADGRWLGYKVLADTRFTTWMLVDTQTGKSQRLTDPLQISEGTRLLLHDARWMGLAVFNMATGQVETRLRRHLSRLPPEAKRRPSVQTFLRGALSSGARYAASAAHDGSIKVWDVAAGTEIATDRGATTGALAVGYDRQDDSRLFSLHWDGTFILWQAEEAPQ